MRRAPIIALAVLVGALAGAWFFVRASLGSDPVRAALEQQLSGIVGQPVRIGSAGASIFPRVTIDLVDVAIGDPAAIRLGTVHVATGLWGLLTRTVEDAEVLVRDGRVTLPLPFPLIASIPPAATTSPTAFITVASVRMISMRDVILTDGTRSVHLDLQSSLDGDRLHVTDLRARAERSRIRASGTVESLATSRAMFDASADPLDLDELVALGSAFTASPPADSGESGTIVPAHVRVRLTAPQGQFASYAFRDLSSTVELTPARVTMAPLELTAFGGSFKGRLDVDTGRKAPQLRLSGDLGGFDAAKLLEASGSPGGLTGTLHGTVSLSGEGREAARVLASTRGTIVAAITDGAWPHLEMVRAIVLAFGRPSGVPPEGSGSAFSRLGGTFALRGGVLTSEDLIMLSRDFDMHGTGSLQILTGALDAHADVVLSRELTAQAGTDLRRYALEDGRVTVPARMTGTLQQPVVSIDLATAAGRAIRNELERRTRSFLEGLIKKRKQ